MIEEFDRKMIDRFLRQNDLKFLIDQDGDYMLDFNGDDIPEYRVQLCVEGADADILGIHATTRMPFPETSRDRLTAFVSGWNRNTRWPKAYVIDDSRGRGTRVIADNSYPLGAGIHYELLHNLIGANMFGVSRMLHELVTAVGTPTADELETWLGRLG